MNFTFNKKEYELIVLSVAGSRLYGNSTPESDWDYRGIMIAKNSDKLGLIDRVEQLGGETGKGKSGELLYDALTKAGISLEKTDDIVIYEVRRFIDLAIKANPNIMDILCHDYKSDASIYINDKGKMLLDAKALFLTKKIKFTFSGYAIAQLNKIKSHNKWIVKYPETTKVLELIELDFNDYLIDFDWIVQNFGTDVAKEVTGETQEEHSGVEECITYKEFYNIHKDQIQNLNMYRIPRLIDFAKPLLTNAKVLKLDDLYIDNIPMDYNLMIKDYLLEHGSFRTLGDSMISLFTSGTGVFGKEGNLKCNDPKEVGEFICLVRFDHHNYKKESDLVKHMWEWKTKRNKSRSVLEDEFGYDTKHASHLVRLMLSADDALTFGTFNPELKDDRLQKVIDVRAGKFTYDYITGFAETFDELLNEAYNKSKLPHKPDIKKINKLLLDIQGV